MLQQVAELRTDVGVLKADVAVLKTDVGVLKTDVAGLKTDVAELKTDVAGLKTDIGVLKGATKRMASELARNTVKLDDLQGLAVATKSSVDRLVGVVESFARDVEAAQRDRKLSSDAYMKHQSQLEDHETRLSRLEEKRR